MQHILKHTRFSSALPIQYQRDAANGAIHCNVIQWPSVMHAGKQRTVGYKKGPFTHLPLQHN